MSQEFVPDENESRLSKFRLSSHIGTGCAAGNGCGFAPGCPGNHSYFVPIGICTSW
jgi:hypothetical protein